MSFVRRFKTAVVQWIPPRLFFPLKTYRMWRGQSADVANWQACWLANTFPLAASVLARTQVNGLRFRRGRLQTARLTSGPSIACYPNSLGVLGVFHEYFGDEGVTLKPGDVVVDIGAHIGSVCVPLASQKGVRVFAYEPDPDNFLVLAHNKAANRLDNLTVSNSAVSAHGDVTLTFSVGYASTQGAIRAAGYRYSLSDAQSVQVPSWSLRDVFAQNDLTSVRLLKVDVEGAEYGIFLDSDCRDLLRKVQTLLIEVHPTDRVNGKYQLYEFLKASGFEVAVVDRARNGCEDFVCENVLKEVTV